MKTAFAMTPRRLQILYNAAFNPSAIEWIVDPYLTAHYRSEDTFAIYVPVLDGKGIRSTCEALRRYRFLDFGDRRLDVLPKGWAALTDHANEQVQW